MSSDFVGTALGKYRILEKLGEGGMGAVYRAEDTRLGRHVALKVLPGLKTADEEARKRFLTEARAASSLQHPHICVLYEFDEIGDTPFIAMQLVEGETLKQVIARGPLTEDRTREVVAAVARALGAAHERGVVHRDVKPDNILLGKDGGVLLTDFGVARLAQGETLTATDQIVGTPAYMSPEQIRGERVTPASDQFSLGAVAYECLTGKPPFTGDNLGVTIHGILNEEPATVSSVRPGLSGEWDAVVSKALRKDSTERHDSVAVLADSLAVSQASMAPRAVASDDSVAILYFENMSSDEESDYFCAGLTEDLLTDLSKIEGLKVASRNAVAKYRGQNVDISRVAADLGVATVLEGSVRKAGSRVRINAQLIKASDGFHLWADRYDRTLDDIFEVQDDITSAIAKALRGALSPEESAAMQSHRPDDVRAYDLYLKADQLYQRYEDAAMREAIDTYQAAIDVEPTYALAWAGLAGACAQMHDKSFDMSPRWLSRGLTAANKAIELDSRLPLAYKSRSVLQSILGDSEESTRDNMRALEIDPTFTPALTNVAVNRVEQGDLAGGERAFRRVMQLDPDLIYAPMLLSVILNYTGRARESLTYSELLLRDGNGPFYQQMARFQRTFEFVLLGEFDAARDELAQGRSTGIQDHAIRAGLQYVDAAAGQDVHVTLNLDLERERKMAWSPYLDFVVAAAAEVGDAQTAIKGLRAAKELDPHSWTHVACLNRLPGFLGKLREDSAFQAYLGDEGRTMVWPSEAPPLEDAFRVQFTDFRVETGIPPAEGIP